MKFNKEVIPIIVLLLIVACRPSPDELRESIGKRALTCYTREWGNNLFSVFPTVTKEIDEVTIVGVSPAGRIQFQYQGGSTFWEDSDHKFLEVLTQKPENEIQKKFWGKKVLLEKYGRVWGDSIREVSPSGRFKLSHWVDWGKSAIIEILENENKESP